MQWYSGKKTTTIDWISWYVWYSMLSATKLLIAIISTVDFLSFFLLKSWLWNWCQINAEGFKIGVYDDIFLSFWRSAYSCHFTSWTSRNVLIRFALSLVSSRSPFTKMRALTLWPCTSINSPSSDEIKELQFQNLPQTFYTNFTIIHISYGTKFKYFTSIWFGMVCMV